MSEEFIKVTHGQTEEQTELLPELLIRAKNLLCLEMKCKEEIRFTHYNSQQTQLQSQNVWKQDSAVWLVMDQNSWGPGSAKH